MIDSEEAFKKLVGCKILDVGEIEDSSDIAFIETDKGKLFFSGTEIPGLYVVYWLEDGLEDIKKMIGETILDVDVNYEEGDKAFQSWSYYKIKTLNHDAHLRFCGDSNGHYCELVMCEWEER